MLGNVCDRCCAAAPTEGVSPGYTDALRARFLHTLHEVDVIGAVVAAFTYHLDPSYVGAVSRDLLLALLSVLKSLIPDAVSAQRAAASQAFEAFSAPATASRASVSKEVVWTLFELRPALVRRAAQAGLVQRLVALVLRYACAPEDTRMTIPDQRTGFVPSALFSSFLWKICNLTPTLFAAQKPVCDAQTRYSGRCV